MRSTAGSSPSSRTARSARSSFAPRSTALLGNGDGAWAAALRTAVLLGETGRERQDCLLVLRRLCEGVARPEAADLVRRALVVTVTRGERQKLVDELDESLLGSAPDAFEPGHAGARQLIRT